MSMGFSSENGMRGFQPAQASWGAFGGSPGGQAEEAEDYLDDEERSRVEQVLSQNEERKH